MGLDMYLFRKDSNEEVAYWRKANAIHNWFVNTVQGGNDDCGDYDVSHDTLRKLRETCVKVLENPAKAKQLLPPKDGFFFGPTSIDGYYFGNIQRTIEKIDRVLEEGIEVQYHSCW